MPSVRKLTATGIVCFGAAQKQLRPNAVGRIFNPPSFDGLENCQSVPGNTDGLATRPTDGAESRQHNRRAAGLVPAHPRAPG